MEQQKPVVIFVVGPTAVGKTETTISIAKELNGEIIYADSMQIYKGMDIGTATPTLEEMDGIPHHLVDVVNPDENFSVAEYEKLAKDHIRRILNKGKTPIVSGGTGLYINSLLFDMDFGDAHSNPELRKKYYRTAEVEGNDVLHQHLMKIDPQAALEIHPNNVIKVVRALEINYETGKNVGNFRENPRPVVEYRPIVIALSRKRKDLYERINRRVDLMIEDGLIDEVRTLLEKGYERDSVAFKGLGYKEIIKYIDGEYPLHDAVRILKRNTRRFAKRQLTWFKRYDSLKWFQVDRYEKQQDLLKDIISYINEQREKGQ